MQLTGGVCRLGEVGKVPRSIRVIMKAVVSLAPTREAARGRCSPFTMKPMIEYDIELYTRQFELSTQIVGQTIEEILFYLETTDKGFTEQPNNYGKSLLNGIDLKTSDLTFSIGNRFTNLGYGLRLDIGKTPDLEYFQDPKEPVSFKTPILKEKVTQLGIYWMVIPFDNETGLYPQEIEIITENGYFLLSSIEVTNEEVNTEFTDELLVIDSLEKAKGLKLGQFGLENGRLTFRDINELKEKIKNGLQHSI